MKALYLLGFGAYMSAGQRGEMPSWSDF
ncbi:protein of unknown function [Ralstonia solanacearum CMR15]|nr:protein of unknown function [Ralstonia solanacearum CMR15]